MKNEKLIKIIDAIKATASEGTLRRQVFAAQWVLSRASALAKKHLTPWIQQKEAEAKGRWEKLHKAMLDSPLRDMDKGKLALRQTLLCCIRAHARGKLHMMQWGKRYTGHSEPISGMDNQRQWVESRLVKMDETEARGSKWYTPELSKELREIARELLAAPAAEKAA